MIKNGDNGNAGENGKNCILYRKDIIADTNIVKLLFGVYVEDTHFNSRLTAIDENHKLIMTNATTFQSTPNSPRNLIITPTLTAYKRILQENLSKPPLLDIVQKTLTSIEM